jgi:outer membrane protein assembly factor BamB
VVTTPVVKNGTVYFGSKDRHFYALDASTGELKWSFDAGKGIDNDCIVHDDSVYFNAGVFNDPHTVYALHAEDGQTIWSFESGEGSIDGPVLENDTLYILRRSGEDRATHIHSFDPASGKERPVVNADGRIVWPSPGGPHWRPAISGSVIYFYDVAVDVASGEVKWQIDLEEASGISGPVILGDELVYFTADGYGLYAVDRQTGELRWTLKSDDLSVTNIYLDGKLFVPKKTSVLALDSDTGEVIWSTRVGFNQWIQAISGDVVYVTNNDKLMALDRRTGKKRWSFSAGTEVCSPPVEVGEQVCFSTLTEHFFGSKKSKQGHLYCIDQKTGKL